MTTANNSSSWEQQLMKLWQPMRLNTDLESVPSKQLSLFEKLKNWKVTKKHRRNGSVHTCTHDEMQGREKENNHWKLSNTYILKTKKLSTTTYHTGCTRVGGDHVPGRRVQQCICRRVQIYVGKPRAYTTRIRERLHTYVRTNVQTRGPLHTYAPWWSIDQTSTLA